MNMQFLNSNGNNVNKQNNQLIRFVNKNAASQQPKAVAQPPSPPVEKPKKMLWGAPTWYLFHTLAEKVKDEEFKNIKAELLNNINVICCNLPCPSCAEHACQYMKKLNYNSINSKEDLKRFLFNFHNEVNQKKNVPAFSINELNDKYAKANTVNIILNFISHFQDKHKSIHMISNDMHRQRIVAVLKGWFNSNINRFN
jgi:hypothetical protein